MFTLVKFLFILISIVVFSLAADLGVRYDKLDSTKFPDAKKRYYFASRLTFPNVKNVFTDVLGSDRGQLAQIAKDAYIAMTETDEYKAFKKRRDAPYVMTALAVENKIYLGTSMKGGGFLYASYEFDNPVYRALFLCGADMRNGASDMHKNDASCGEITTMLGYTKDTQNKGTGLDGAKIVTVRSTTPSDGPVYPVDPNSIEVFDPCGWDQDPEHPDNKGRADFVPGAFGCYQTTKQLKVDPYLVNQFRPYKIGERKGAQKQDDPQLFDVGYAQLFC